MKKKALSILMASFLSYPALATTPRELKEVLERIEAGIPEAEINKQGYNIKDIVKSGVINHVNDITGSSFLDEQIMNRSFKAVKFLVENGALMPDPNFTLELALESGSQKIFNYLVKAFKIKLTLAQYNAPDFIEILEMIRMGVSEAEIKRRGHNLESMLETGVVNHGRFDSEVSFLDREVSSGNLQSVKFLVENHALMPFVRNTLEQVLTNRSPKTGIFSYLMESYDIDFIKSAYKETGDILLKKAIKQARYPDYVKIILAKGGGSDLDKILHYAKKRQDILKDTPSENQDEILKNSSDIIKLLEDKKAQRNCKNAQV